jgi:RNA polymerase sigma-70 factor (ECF subfamily)
MRSPVSGRPDALQLFLTHRARLLSHAVRLTGDAALAEDVLQEAWLRFEAATAHRALA